MEALNEIRAWIFDLVPCIWRYVVRKIRSWFGRLGVALGVSEEVESSDLVVSCCMSSLFMEIQNSINNNAVLRARNGVRGLYDKITGAPRAIGTAVSSTLSDISSSFCDSYPYLCAEIPTVTETTNFAEPSVWSNLWAMSDEREKIKVLEKPVYTLEIDGKRVNFYIFAWKPGAIFYDGFQFHTSVMAQEIMNQYPRAVFIYHDRYFVILKYLPPEVVKHMFMLQTPMIDMTPHMPQ